MACISKKVIPFAIELPSIDNNYSE